MGEPSKDVQRALAASKAIFDGRDASDMGAVMVTLEYTVSAVLLALMRDPAKAAAMLNEGLLQGVEQRLALYASKKESRP